MPKTYQQEIYKELISQNKATEFFLRTPAETGKNFVDYVAWTNSLTMLDYGCILDQHLTPPLPGDFISVMARPGHKKSLFMACQAKRYARQIVKDGLTDKEVVIYVTWDEAVENVEGYIQGGSGHFDAGDVAWGRVERQQAEYSTIQRVTDLAPLWVWGLSLMDSNRSKPDLSPDWLFSTVQALKHKYKLTVKALFLDYLQKIPIKNEANRTSEVTAASNAAKWLAKDIGCGVFAGVQASRSSEKNESMIPGWSDAQHASAIEQDSTKQLALVNPIKYTEPGEYIQVGNSYHKVDANLTIVKILKQRGAEGRGTYAINLNPKTLEINDCVCYNKEQVDLN